MVAVALMEAVSVAVVADMVDRLDGSMALPKDAEEVDRKHAHGSLVPALSVQKAEWVG